MIICVLRPQQYYDIIFLTYLLFGVYFTFRRFISLSIMSYGRQNDDVIMSFKDHS